LIEDASVDEDYIAMTKEIALLAPPEEPEENEEPAQPVTKTNPKVETSDQTTERGAKVTDTSERKSQPKPQREKPPRFDRTGKRRVAANSDETKREQSGGAKGRKNSRDSLGSQKPQAKAFGVSNAVEVFGKSCNVCLTVFRPGGGGVDCVHTNLKFNLQQYGANFFVLGIYVSVPTFINSMFFQTFDFCKNSQILN